MIKKIFIPLIVTILISFSCKESSNETSRIQNNLIVSFYNVENLLDTKDNPKKIDNEFLPNGRYKWTEEKYNQKLKNLAKVILDIHPDIIGFAEVENRQVLKDLNKLLPSLNLEIVHSESHDIRGIDQAVLYNTKKLKFLKQEDISGRMKDGKYAGPRDILKASFSSEGKELDVYVNHWPSRRGGKEQKRIAFSKHLAKSLKEDQSPYILLGDFNDTPTNTSIRNLSKSDKNLYNPFSVLARAGKGTATYKNKWLLFDQIMVDSSKIELKTYRIEDFEYIKNKNSGKYNGYPSRTFIGNKYNKNGYSDHFPVSVKINIK